MRSVAYEGGTRPDPRDGFRSSLYKVRTRNSGGGVAGRAPLLVVAARPVRVLALGLEAIGVYGVIAFL